MECNSIFHLESYSAQPVPLYPASFSFLTVIANYVVVIIVYFCVLLLCFVYVVVCMYCM